MNLIEIEEHIKKAESLLNELNEKRHEEIRNIVSKFKPGDIFECNIDSTVKHFEVVRINKNKIVYNTLMIHGNTVERRSSYNSFIEQLNVSTGFKSKLKREYNLKKLGC